MKSEEQSSNERYNPHCLPWVSLRSAVRVKVKVISRVSARAYSPICVAFEISALETFTFCTYPRIQHQPTEATSVKKLPFLSSVCVFAIIQRMRENRSHCSIIVSSAHTFQKSGKDAKSKLKFLTANQINAWQQHDQNRVTHWLDFDWKHRWFLLTWRDWNQQIHEIDFPTVITAIKAWTQFGVVNESEFRALRDWNEREKTTHKHTYFIHRTHEAEHRVPKSSAFFYCVLA